MKLHGRITKMLAIAAAIAVLAGCTPTPPQALLPYLDQKAKWGSCDSDWLLKESRRSEIFNANAPDCTTVRVPALYEVPDTKNDFAIALMRIKATGRKIGTLFINPGGPGGSGVHALQFLDFPPQLLEAYDIIGFDPRGVELSDFADGREIKCSETLYYAMRWATDSDPDSDFETEQDMQVYNDYFQDCSDRNPLWHTLTTANVVKDLEILRSVVTGAEPLNFLGTSYGTTIAADYVREYPRNVGRIVFDSPTNAGNDTLESLRADWVAFEAQLNSWISGYAIHSGRTVPQVRKLLLSIRRWGEAGQLRGFAGTEVIDAKNHIFRSNVNLYLSGIFSLSYQSEKSAQEYFNQAIDELATRRWNGFFEELFLFGDGYDIDLFTNRTSYDPSMLKHDNGYEMLYMFRTMDVNWPAFSEEFWADFPLVSAQSSPFWNRLEDGPGDYYYDGDKHYKGLTAIALEDNSIPNPPNSLPERQNLSGKQFLIVGSRNESVTPFMHAEATAKALKSPLVVYEGSRHGPVSDFDVPCLNAIFLEYMLYGMLPNDQTSCKP